MLGVLGVGNFFSYVIGNAVDNSFHMENGEGSEFIYTGKWKKKFKI